MAEENMTREGLIWKVMTTIAEVEGQSLVDLTSAKSLNRKYVLELLHAVDIGLRAVQSK